MPTKRKSESTEKCPPTKNKLEQNKHKYAKVAQRNTHKAQNPEKENTSEREK